MIDMQRKTRKRLGRTNKTIVAGCCMALFALTLSGCVPKVGPTPPPLPTQQVTPSPTAQPSPSSQPPTQVIPEEPAVQLIDPESLPTEQTLGISREGEEEEMTALRQISDYGYVIYTLPDFEWSEQGENGTVAPSDASGIDKGINIKIIAANTKQSDALLEQAQLTLPNYVFERRDSGLAVPADAGAVVGAYGEKGDQIAQISAFTLGGGTYAVILSYPREAAEGGLVLLQAMVSTMVAYQ